VIQHLCNLYSTKKKVHMCSNKWLRYSVRCVIFSEIVHSHFFITYSLLLTYLLIWFLIPTCFTFYVKPTILPYTIIFFAVNIDVYYKKIICNSSQKLSELHINLPLLIFWIFWNYRLLWILFWFVVYFKILLM